MGFELTFRFASKRSIETSCCPISLKLKLNWSFPDCVYIFKKYLEIKGKIGCDSSGSQPCATHRAINRTALISQLASLNWPHRTVPRAGFFGFFFCVEVCAECFVIKWSRGMYTCILTHTRMDVYVSLDAHVYTCILTRMQVCVFAIIETSVQEKKALFLLSLSISIAMHIVPPTVGKQKEQRYGWVISHMPPTVRK